MARKGLSSKTVRQLAPLVVPLVTRVALPLAARSLRRGRRERGDGAKSEFDRNLKKTRSELEDVADEAVTRGRKVYEEARKQGSELLDLLAAKGVEVAQEWAESVARPRRRRFPLGKLIVVAALVGVGLYAFRRK